MNVIQDRALRARRPVIFSGLAAVMAVVMAFLVVGLPGPADAAPAAPAAPAAQGATALIDERGMAFVRVPAGEFRMGTDVPAADVVRAFSGLDPARADDLQDEYPAHRVQISRDFYLGRYEVTVDEFRAFVRDSGYLPESQADGTGAYGYSPAHDRNRAEAADAFEGRSTAYSWEWPGFAQTGREPVTNVSWNDAMAMARWLTQRTGVRYRLPTEAEWEYACRAGSQTLFPDGDTPAGLARVANTFDQSALPYWIRWHDQALPANDGAPFTSPVGRYAPNAFGLHDMVGNVWEWVSDAYDAYDPDTYRTSPQVDPQGPAQGKLRVRRGGSWHTWALYARCGFRNINTPESRYPLLGFRLVREAADAAPR